MAADTPDGELCRWRGAGGPYASNAGELVSCSFLSTIESCGSDPLKLFWGQLWCVNGTTRCFH